MRNVIKTLKRLTRRTGNMPQLAFPPVTVTKLIRQVERTQEVEYACEKVHRLLDQFAEAVMRGEDAAHLMPLVQRHLDMCPDCREEYEALLRILKASPA